MIHFLFKQSEKQQKGGKKYHKSEMLSMKDRDPSTSVYNLVKRYITRRNALFC